MITPKKAQVDQIIFVFLFTDIPNFQLCEDNLRDQNAYIAILKRKKQNLNIKKKNNNLGNKCAHTTNIKLF